MYKITYTQDDATSIFTNIDIFNFKESHTLLEMIPPRGQGICVDGKDFAQDAVIVVTIQPDDKVEIDKVLERIESSEE